MMTIARRMRIREEEEEGGGERERDATARLRGQVDRWVPLSA